MKRALLPFIVVLIAACAFASPASASDARKATSIGDEYPVTMRGVRPLGMGNAFLAMPGTDFIAPFYNPAAINDYPSERGYTVGAPMADFTPDFFNLISQLLDLKDQLHSAASSRDKIQYFDSFTTRNTGRYEGFTSSMPLFQVRHKRYTAAVIADTRAVISLRDQAFPNFEFKTHSAMGFAGGSAYGFFDDSLQIGGNLKVLYRMGIEDKITTNDILTSGIKQLIGFPAWKKGFGVGADAGLKYRLPLWREEAAPTIAVAVQDIANTRFTGSVSQLPMSVSAGFGFFPKFGGNPFSFLVDFRELNHRMDFLTKFHAGVEATLPKLGVTQFKIRAGCNQGYPAFGLSGAWPLFALDLAFYGEEAGQYTTSKASYRLSAQLSFTW